MLNFNEILTFDSKNAYDFAYDLSMRKNFSTPKIYTANGDLKKRWYVYFSFRNPETGKLKRITPFYGDANKHKTKSDRMFVLLVYKHKIEELLKKDTILLKIIQRYFKNNMRKIIPKWLQLKNRQLP